MRKAQRKLDSPLLTVRVLSPFCVFAFCERERHNVTRLNLASFGRQADYIRARATNGRARVEIYVSLKACNLCSFQGWILLHLNKSLYMATIFSRSAKQKRR